MEKAATQTLSIATMNALQTCAAFSAYVSDRVLIVASDHHLGKTLSEYLQLTQGIQYIYLKDGDDNSSITSEIDDNSRSTLIWVKQFNSDLHIIESLLRHPNLGQVIMLRANWLGRKILPEWDSQSGKSLASNSLVGKMVKPDQDWTYHETTIGNLSSLLWGFASGRLLALNQPSRADLCNARMRLHLFPVTGRSGPSYLTITRIVRQKQEILKSSADSEQ